MHHAYFNLAQNIWVYSTPTYWKDNFLSSVWVCSRHEFFMLWCIFCRQLLRHFPRLKLADFFVVFFITYFDFFSDIKSIQYRIGNLAETWQQWLCTVCLMCRTQRRSLTLSWRTPSSRCGPSDDTTRSSSWLTPVRWVPEGGMSPFTVESYNLLRNFPLL